MTGCVQEGSTAKRRRTKRCLLSAPLPAPLSATSPPPPPLLRRTRAHGKDTRQTGKKHVCKHTRALSNAHPAAVTAAPIALHCSNYCRRGPAAPSRQHFPGPWAFCYPCYLHASPRMHVPLPDLPLSSCWPAAAAVATAADGEEGVWLGRGAAADAYPALPPAAAAAVPAPAPPAPAPAPPCGPSELLPVSEGGFLWWPPMPAPSAPSILSVNEPRREGARRGPAVAPEEEGGRPPADGAVPRTVANWECSGGGMAATDSVGVICGCPSFGCSEWICTTFNKAAPRHVRVHVERLITNITH